MLTEINERHLSELRKKLASGEIVPEENIRLSGKRLMHSYSVEREVAKLAEIYAPDEEYELRAAALLHDITKQLNLEKQLQLCDKFGIMYKPLDKLMPRTLHARTAVEVIKCYFPEFSDDAILSAVRYHTTGRTDMSIGEKLLYLADYIEPTREFEDCVKLRNYFYAKLEQVADETGRQKVLRETLILSFDMTISGLIEEGIPIHVDTCEARNYLIEENELEKR
jgi:nicotinate-nucleotide adenylyltransferase